VITWFTTQARSDVATKPALTSTSVSAWVIALAALTSFALTSLTGCATPRAQALAVELAPGVYMVPGAIGSATTANRGWIANTGFIVGDSGVVVVDTGTSFEQGAALLEQVRRVTDKPVLLALITHVQPEFLFGANAFRAAHIPIQMHAKSARLMASRCETCLKNLRQTVGEVAMAGTSTFKPDQEFDAAQDITAGGVSLQVLYFGHSSGPGDIAVLDRRSRVLFGGGLIDQGRIPDILDSDIVGWKAALSELRALGVARVVPGHGPASSAELITTVLRYLTQLDQSARSLFEAGTSLIDVADAIALPEFENWDQYDAIHRRNAAIAFLRVERQLFLKSAETGGSP
jgi:glyoxylase-like metal-dependent hydrolase (beta-lactamase superfamily II)